MHVRRDSKNKVLSSVYARTRVQNHRECTYLFQHTRARRIYSLWHVRVVQKPTNPRPPSWLQPSTLYACTITVIPRLARSYRTAQSFGRCDRRRFHRISSGNELCSIDRSQLCTVFSNQLCSSSFYFFVIRFLFFFSSRGINEYIWRVNCMVKKILLLTRIIYILLLSFSSSIVKWNYHTRGAKFQLNKFPIYSIGLPSFF